MTEQYIAGEPTRSVTSKMTYVRAGTVLLLLLCLASSTTVLVSAGPVRIKAGDWIRYDSINRGQLPFPPVTAWSKVEFLSVSSPMATVLVTMNRTDGTEKVNTNSIRVAFDNQSSGGFSGFIIPTDLDVGGVFRVSGWGNVTITGETTRTYAGASRTVVYAPYGSEAGSSSQNSSGVETISYWDKQTGIFLEEITTAPNYTMSFKATTTNIWAASSSGGFKWQILGAIAIPVAGVITVTALLMRRRKHTTLPPQNESNS